MSGLVQIAADFWNIRGSFKIGGLVDVGTHVSLVRRGNGKFMFLDAYTLPTRVEKAIGELTRGGKDIEAILNLHPFHTLHVRPLHERYRHARLYGTARHHAQFPELPWEKVCTEDPNLHARFAEDFDFSVPRGVDFISSNQNVHFSSVLMLHRASKTIHVDDTLMYVRLPAPLGWLGKADVFSFHPTLSQALQRRTGAADEFHLWAEELAERWQGAENLCAAHTATLTARDNPGGSIHERLLKALEGVAGKLAAHRRNYG